MNTQVYFEQHFGSIGVELKVLAQGPEEGDELLVQSVLSWYCQQHLPQILQHEIWEW